jgi:glutaredoxin
MNYFLKLSRLPILFFAATILSLSLYVGGVSGSEITSLSPTTNPQAGIGWAITSTSGSSELALAKHLTSKGVKLYTAYWCPHCHEQKQLFGKQAWGKIKNIECAEDAKQNPQPQLCKKAGIKGFPTWSINGKLQPGVKTLKELSALTGYQGQQAFKYDKLLGAK